jgi:hypothetical protein
MKANPSSLALVAGLVLLGAGAAAAQDLQKNVTYVCGGERLVVDSCNIRDLSDTSTCMVGHPDTILPNGLMKYTNETRGALKKLLPTCKQPSADQVARAKAFEKKQNDLHEANIKKANDENDAIEARAQQVITGKKPQTADERAITRCITSGRLPASCPLWTTTKLPRQVRAWPVRTWQAFFKALDIGGWILRTRASW